MLVTVFIFVFIFVFVAMIVAMERHAEDAFNVRVRNADVAPVANLRYT